MKTPIIFFASILFKIGQCSDIQYEHELGFRSIGQYLKIFWSDGEGYELTYNKIRFEFDYTGKLTQALFGTNKYELGDTSESCNVPEGIDYTYGVVETRGSDKNPYTCSQCQVVVEEACGEGIKQICNYSTGVVDNPPFNKWSVNSFSRMCQQFYAACDIGRVESECKIRCSASDPPTLKAEICIAPTPSPIDDTTCAETEVWRWQGSSDSYDYLQSSVLTNSGDIIFSGYTAGSFSGNQIGINDFFAFSMNPGDRSENWRWQDGTIESDSIFTSTLTDIGYVVLAGRTVGNFSGNNNGNYDFAAVALDTTDGSEVWRWQDGTPDGDIILTAVSIDSNKIVLSGSTDGNFHGPGQTGYQGYSDFVAIALDPTDGSEIWRWQDGTPRDESITASTLVDSGTIILSGSTNGDFNGIGRGNSDFVAVALDPADGSEIWRWQDGTTTLDRIQTATLVDANTIVLAGHTLGEFSGSNQGSIDFVAVALDITDGSEIWRWQGGTPNNDFIYTSVLVNDGTILFAGDTKGALNGQNHGRDDFASVALDLEDRSEIWSWQDGTFMLDSIKTSVLVGDNVVLAGITESTFSGTSTSAGDFAVVELCVS